MEAQPEPVAKERAEQPMRPIASPGVQDDGSIVSAVTWFEGELDDALATAKAEGKLVFVDVGAYWCPPCHELDEKLFVLPEIGEFLGASYVALHIDAEKGEGPEIVARYEVQAYPTMLVLDANGIEKGRIVDFAPAEEFKIAMQRIAVGENVLHDLVAAVEAKPDDPKARYTLGSAYALAARRAEAEAQFDEVMLADPRDEMGLASEVLHDRAFMFTFKLDGEEEKAIAQLRELQERFPESKAATRAYRTIGRLYAALGEQDEAIAELEKMIAIDPEDPELAASYGWFSFREKCKPEAGLRVVTAAIERAPKSAELHYLAAELEHLLGRDAEALAAIRRASELEPKSAYYKRQVRRFGELVGA